MAGIYLHIPFCEHKCTYCDFFSVEDRRDEGRLVEALKAEIALVSGHAKRETVGTVYFGGGTPSLLEASVIEEILVLIRSTANVSPDAEITLEANPGTVDDAKLRDFRRVGVNRLSIGIQSFHDRLLKGLTRIHTAQEARSSVEAARAAGFSNVSIDLIFALPGETISEWESDLREAVALRPEHISAYSLIVEEGTPLHTMVAEGTVEPAPLETEARMYESAMAALAHAGYEHYEVSNYARRGFRSLHNSNYWNHSNYLGLGPSAHSFWSDRRWWNVRSISAYCDAVEHGMMPVAGREELSRSQLLSEAIMLGLRADGVDLAMLLERYGDDLRTRCSGVIGGLMSDGLARIELGKLALSDKGYLLCDKIVEMLVPGTVLP